MKTTLIKPIITEKSMLAASRGVYTFQVLMSCSKHQVKESVETIFKVNVEKINTVTRFSPAKSSGPKRLPGKSARFKIATVKLKKGQTIDLFDLKETSSGDK